MKSIGDANIAGKRVLVRADLDIPPGTEQSMEAATRLTNLKPTVDYLIENNAAKVIIAGHIDRPTKPDPDLSCAQLLGPLESILLRSIVFKPDLAGGESALDKQELSDKVVLLENLRFWPGEVENSMDFAKELAQLADIYVNEAFGNCHRQHASMVLLPKLLPAFAGLHLAEEVKVLSGAIQGPKRPFVAIVGGAKIETKVPAIENLTRVADVVLVGGELPVEIAKIGEKFEKKVIVAKLTGDQKDITADSAREFEKVITGAKTVVWNGPMGLFEEGYKDGSRRVAGAIIASGAYSVVGGGETCQFLAENNLISKFSFVSAGGGAMLEFLAGKKLPAVEALG